MADRAASSSSAARDRSLMSRSFILNLLEQVVGVGVSDVFFALEGYRAWGVPGLDFDGECDVRRCIQTVLFCCATRVRGCGGRCRLRWWFWADSRRGGVMGVCRQCGNCA